MPVGSSWTDIWGTTWQKEQENVMGFPAVHPIAGAKDLSRYKLPNPNDERIIKKISEQAKGWDRENTFLVGAHRDILWAKLEKLCGMEKAMMFLYDEPEALRGLLHGIMDFHLAMAGHYLKAGIEVMTLAEDLGTQASPLLPPDVIRDLLVPEYKRLFSLYRANGVYIFFHSCGNIMPIADIFIGLGVNILDPIQATANDLDELRRKTAGKLALHGGVNSAILAKGDIREIEEETERRMLQLGRNGGYFCTCDQHMPWKEESIQAMRRTVEQRGRYPLSSQ